MAQKTSNLSKTHLDYWKNRLEKRSYIHQGKRRAIPDWHVRLAHNGVRQYFNLKTTNQTAAATKAKELWLFLQSNGLEATLIKYKPEDPYAASRKGNCTIAEFLAEVKSKSGLKPKTFDDYAKCFRQVVSEINKINAGKTKFDYAKGGREKWVNRIESIKLATITPAKVQKWKLAYLEKAGTDRVKQKAARITLNKIIRNARSLFSSKALRFVEVTLPDHLPFEGIDFEKEGSFRYHSEIDPELLLIAAQNELAKHKPEQFKIFVLALLAGLRRNEIDKLEWQSVDFENCIIRIEPTRYFQPKSEDALGEIEVDREVIETLRTYYPKAKDRFVINSPNAPRPKATYEHYRCEKEFNALIKWLRSKSITAKNPLHSLRKEFGSLINAQAGIFEASRALRHSSTQVTERHYLDSKRRVTAGLGFLLKIEPIELIKKGQRRVS